MLPTWGKVAVLISFAVPFMLLGMTWLHYTTDVSLGLSLRRAYFVLNDVPDHIINETDDRALPPLIVLHIISMVTFAVLLGVFIDDISNGVSAFKSGNFPIPERNHTVIVASDKRQLVHVLREVFANQAERALRTNSMVAVLHPGSKEDLDNDLMDELGPEAMAHVVTRSGNLLKTADLALVSGGTARTVVLLQAPVDGGDCDDDGGDDSGGSAAAMRHKAQQAVALASLQSLRAEALTEQSASAKMKEPLYEQHVVLQQAGNDEDSADGEWDAVTALLRGTGSTVVTKMSSSSNLARIMCQTAVTPGISEVLAMMAQHSKGGPEIYLREVTHIGATFREARRHFDKAVACGIYTPSTDTMSMCPRDDVVLQAGDRLLLMADDAKHAVPRSSPRAVIAAAAAEADAKGSTAAKPKAAPKCPSCCSGTGRYVLLCFEPGEVDAFASAMHEFCPPGSEIVLVCRDAVKVNKKDFPGMKMQVVQGDPSRTSTLRAARVQDSETVMVAGLGGLTSEEGDAQTLSTLLQIKSLLREGSGGGGGDASERNERRKLHVVACVNEIDTRAAMAHVAGLDAGAGRAMSLDLVAAEEILSGILAQVACEPMMMPVWSDLMNADGCEIYVKSVRALDLPTGVTLTWAAVQEALAPHQTIALGYVGGDGQHVLMPEPSLQLELQTGDKLVVISEN
jgi:Trk K+ transport system NAD-binding subunit